MFAQGCAVLVGAYFVGAVPFSYLVARAFGVADVRKVGSGNVGATNVMRSAGKLAGVLAFLLDAGKGALAVLLARQMLPESVGWHPWAGLSAVLGHMFPVWLGFAGGKGVATGAGAFVPLVPGAAGAAFGAFVGLLAVSRYVSVASIGGALTLPLVALATGAPREVWACAMVVAALVVARHHENVARLWRGQERRLGRARPSHESGP